MKREAAGFWRGWASQFAKPSPVRARQLDLFNVPEQGPPDVGTLRYLRGWWYCSEGHRHRTQATGDKCEAKRRV